MSDAPPGTPGPRLVFDADIDAPPDTVWRAICIPEIREKWLPDADLADAEALPAPAGGRAVRFRMRDPAPPFLDSAVTFTLTPNGEGGTRLRIAHALRDPRAAVMMAGANDNAAALARAA